MERVLYVRTKRDYAPSVSGVRSFCMEIDTALQYSICIISVQKLLYNALSPGSAYNMIEEAKGLLYPDTPC